METNLRTHRLTLFYYAHMPIRILPQSGLSFADVHGVFRSIRGVPLSRRPEFIRLHQQACDRYLSWLDTEKPWEELWAHQPFRSAVNDLLAMAHLKMDWLISDDQSINHAPQLLFYYPRDGKLFIGDWIAWEFPGASTGGGGESFSNEKGEAEAFSSLIITDVNGSPAELFPLTATDYYRFVDLMEALQPMMDQGFHYAYDSNEIARRLVNESLRLFGLDPDRVSASLAIELLFADWEDKDGGRAYLPGWLYQLCNPPMKIDKGDPLPEGEHPYHALIASAWGDAGLMDAIAAVSSIPYPDLIGVMHSRSRMIRETFGDRTSPSGRKTKENRFGMKLSKAEQKKFDSIDFAALRAEFEENPILPTSLPDGSAATSKLAG